MIGRWLQEKSWSSSFGKRQEYEKIFRGGLWRRISCFTQTSSYRSFECKLDLSFSKQVFERSRNIDTNKGCFIYLLFINVSKTNRVLNYRKFIQASYIMEIHYFCKVHFQYIVQAIIFPGILLANCSSQVERISCYGTRQRISISMGCKQHPVKCTVKSCQQFV